MLWQVQEEEEVLDPDGTWVFAYQWHLGSGMPSSYQNVMWLNEAICSIWVPGYQDVPISRFPWWTTCNSTIKHCLHYCQAQMEERTCMSVDEKFTNHTMLMGQYSLCFENLFPMLLANWQAPWACFSSIPMLFFSASMHSWYALTNKPTCNKRKYEPFSSIYSQPSICKFEVTEKNNAIMLGGKPRLWV